MATVISETDYASSGMDISSATLAAVKALGRKPPVPFAIMWAGKIIQGADQIEVPKHGRVVLELLQYSSEFKQGFDIKTRGGFVLADGLTVPLLRTWADQKFEDRLEYEYRSTDGVLHTWNVYARTIASGEVRDEKWTGNAGFWVEKRAPADRIYHCSHGMADPPCFDTLVYRVRVLPL